MDSVSSKHTDNDDVFLKRHIWESEEVYNLRRSFLLAHRNSPKFKSNPQRLQCLAQLVINIEFLGCVYDDCLMQEVAELTSNLLEDRRERQRSGKILAVESSKFRSQPVEYKKRRI